MVYHGFKAANWNWIYPSENKDIASVKKSCLRKCLHLVFAVKGLLSSGRNKLFWEAGKSWLKWNNVKGGLEGNFPLMKTGSKDNAKCCWAPRSKGFPKLSKKTIGKPPHQTEMQNVVVPITLIWNRGWRNKTKRNTIKHYTHLVFVFTAVSKPEHPRNSADVSLKFLAEDKHLLEAETEPSG